MPISLYRLRIDDFFERHKKYNKKLREIRYYRPTETIAAKELETILERKPPAGEFKLVGVKTPTEGIISIFLPADRVVTR